MTQINVIDPLTFHCSMLGSTSYKKKCFLSGIAQITSPPLPPIRATCTTFFGRQKRRLAHITDPSNMITTMM